MMNKNENKKSAVILRAEHLVSARQDLFDKCRDCFNISAKTSENCNKLSKSVSYETLVGDTTTTGTTYKQTQSLSKSSADYRFCKTMRFSYENLVEILLQTSPVFRFVKIFTIAVILSVVILSESRADNCPDGIDACADNCDSYQPLGYEKSYGTNCSWQLRTDGVLIIRGTGSNASAGEHIYATPWDSYRDKIKVVVADNIYIPGTGAYYCGVFGSIANVPHLILLNGSTTNENLTNRTEVHNCTKTDVEGCLLAAGFGCGQGKVVQEGKCVSACGASFRLNDGECDRIRYTPAEAAQYLKDTDN